MAVGGSAPVEGFIHRNVIDNLDFIPTGVLPPNRSDFLLHLNFSTLLETVSPDYDLVLIDTPPLLLAADALVIGARAGSVFLLARAHVTTDAEITEAFAGNLCRCGTHTRIVRAIQRASGNVAGTTA